MLDRQKELRFRVSEAELSQIQENAKTLGMQLHPFVRYVGTEYAVIVEDRTHFYEHRDSVSAINRFLDYLEYTIEAGGKFTSTSSSETGWMSGANACSSK